MMKTIAVRALDVVGLSTPARRAASHLPKIASRLRDMGVLPWKPLVPEAAFSACVSGALGELQRRNPAEATGDYLEFGVSRGTSMTCVFRVLQERALSHVRLIGFDSFEGMPAEASGEGWRPGEFRSTLAATRRYLAAREVDLDRVTLVKGWFKDTLTPGTRSRLAINKASLILIDCDIYTASKEALAFCEPHIHDRAVMIFDDWGLETKLRNIGQKEAFAEFLADHPDIRAEPLPAYVPQARVFMLSRQPAVDPIGLQWGGTMRFERSEALRRRAHMAIPGGAHTYAKGDDQFPERSPGFIARGQGCRVWDEDGNEFIEYGMGLRAVALGHAFPPVVEAVRRSLDIGTNFSRPHAMEVECAEALLAAVPFADMVKFTKDGSTAVTAAVKLARAATGRDLVAICRDHPFFSYDDWFIGTTQMDSGIPPVATSLTRTFPYDDLDALRTLFESESGRIACVVLEACKYEDPSPGYLHEVRRLCHANGALLIIDEMINGFRLAQAGGQQYYGVEPDLSTFGKALANGFAVSALAGKREYMELGGLHHDRDRVFLLSTTHGGEVPGLAAALATMRAYRELPVIETIDRQGRRLAEGLRQAIAAHGLSEHVPISGKSCNLVFGTLDREKRPSQHLRALLMQELIARGVIAPSLVVSYSHDDAAVDRTVEAFDGAMPTYRRALEDGVEGLLAGPPTAPVYRRRNRA